MPIRGLPGLNKDTLAAREAAADTAAAEARQLTDRATPVAVRPKMVVGGVAGAEGLIRLVRMEQVVTLEAQEGLAQRP